MLDELEPLIKEREQVADVVVTPSSATVKPGASLQFSAKVNFTDNQTVTWSVFGNSETGTIINDTGLLTVDDDEAVGTVLTVTAVSDEDDTKSASATVTVIAPDAVPITSVEVTVTTPEINASPAAAVTINTTPANFTAGAVTWTRTDGGTMDSTFLGGTEYKATVTLTADANYTFPTEGITATFNGVTVTPTANTGSTITIERVFTTSDKTVIGIAIQTQPTNLSYTHGGTLDLSGLVVTLTYNDSTTANVAFADFGTRGISTSPANGTTLIYLTHNTPVTVSVNGQSATTNNLTVNPAQITSAAIFITAPVKGAIGATTPTTTSTDFITGGITWTPSLSDSRFFADTEYTASVTLIRESSNYSFTDISPDAVTVNGNVATITDNAGLSITLSYTFPATSVALININAEPAASTTLKQGSITASNTLSVTATVDGGATPSYQWYSNTTASNTGGSSISGETSATFNISTSLTADTYYYYCVVGANLGAVSVPSNVATVVVEAAASYTVGGEGPGGGIIFYHNPEGFLVEGYGNEGDPGYFPGYTAYYLEVALANTTDSEWRGSDTGIVEIPAITTWVSAPDANQLTDSIGKGRRDTQIIVAFYGASNTTNAAYRASKYKVTPESDYDDWFLPSLGELNLLDEQRFLAGIIISGDFWSSSQSTGLGAWALYFGGGNRFANNKFLSYSVRAIRAF